MRVLSVIILLCVAVSSGFAQYNDLKSANEYLEKKGEVYFKFSVFDKAEVDRLSEIISIDNFREHTVYAYANREEFENFLKLNYNFEILKHPGDNEGIRMSDEINEIREWDSYPTYDGYTSMMNQFGTTFPNICQIVDIGGTVQGRRLLFAKVTDSVSIRKDKPRFMYTSSMHGDEITAYVLMLRLIDTLCKGYGVNPKITYLLNNVEIWINPLANPDGTYHGGNNTVSGAIRNNANNKDLNRNFPDPAAGPNPGGTWQPETIAFMNIATLFNFSLSMNFHGGAQVLNYPWDTWGRLHPDDDWFIHVSRRFVDTVHSINPSYMTDLLGYPNIPGIVNGFSWYRITGGRQDYMTYFRGSREITNEISSTKAPAGSTLPNYWNYNFKSFLNYIQESLYGIRGIITDSVTGLPVKAKVRVNGKEIADSTWINSDSLIGDYHRYISNGTYTLSFSAPNYITKTISNVYVQKDSTTILNVQLSPTSTLITEETNPVEYKLHQNYPNPFNPTTNIRYETSKSNFVTLKIYDILGKEISTLVNEYQMPGVYEYQFDASIFPSGIYYYKLVTNNFSETKKMILVK
ncbi:MAG: T9SS type A sorting domain-containing protein [Ignavibacteria bacterium]|nr:T9SS type A sorting domain-containing protein [Ignavibacteria bacterium]